MKSLLLLALALVILTKAAGVLLLAAARFKRKGKRR